MASRSAIADVVCDPYTVREPDPDAVSGLVAATEQVLKNSVNDRAAALASTDAGLELLASAARNAVLSPGKRIRPSFAFWGWAGAVGGPRPVADILPALAALELLHAFALVHDDVMDESPVRRGRPTAHCALTQAHVRSRLRGDASRFGESGAILVGDLCLVWADELMAQAAVPVEALRAARRVYDSMRAEAIAGQFLDVLGEATHAWTVERALLVTRLKTAGYTVMWPLLFGATLGGVATHPGQGALTDTYRAYGQAVGEAFQLRDDLLDLYGEPEVLGKPTGADVVKGKPTVLLQLARSLADPAQGAELDRLLRAGPRADLDRVRRIVSKTGAADRARQLIDQRVSAATDALVRAPIDARTKHALEQLAFAVVERSS
jgi:geranylgeranyl diphosphate synthase, type I